MSAFLCPPADKIRLVCQLGGAVTKWPKSLLSSEMWVGLQTPNLFSIQDLGPRRLSLLLSFSGHQTWAQKSESMGDSAAPGEPHLPGHSAPTLLIVPGVCCRSSVRSHPCPLSHVCLRLPGSVKARNGLKSRSHVSRRPLGLKSGTCGSPGPKSPTSGGSWGSAVCQPRLDNGLRSWPRPLLCCYPSSS